MKKQILVVGLVLGMGSGFIFSRFFPSLLHINQPPKVLLTKIQTTTFHPPIKLIVPKIDIETPIEETGMDEKGNMGVPRDPNNVAWFKLGYYPGEKGAAVISGHLDTKTGSPGVFYKLNTLRKGDTIIVIDLQGKQYTFFVYDLVSYDFDKLPLSQIFGSMPRPSLNLITCDGVFDKHTQNYTKRLVVYATLYSN